MGTWFCGTNKISKDIYEEHISGHRSCNKMGGGQSIMDKYCNSDSNFFIHECILTRFGCPLCIVIDQGVHLINDAIKHLIDNIKTCQFHYLLST